MNKDEILTGLNDRQVEAVKHLDGPASVVAGAGTGKTTVLTRRLAYLLASGVDGRQVLAMTFTNKAAREMKERAFQMVGSRALELTISTFHSFGVRVLRENLNKLQKRY